MRPPCGSGCGSLLDRADRVAAAAACAEAAGFDSVWVPDPQLRWRDTSVALALAAASTKRITLAPGVTTLITTPLAGDTAGALPYEFIESFSAAGLLS